MTAENDNDIRHRERMKKQKAVVDAGIEKATDERGIVIDHGCLFFALAGLIDYFAITHGGTDSYCL